MEAWMETFENNPKMTTISTVILVDEDEDDLLNRMARCLLSSSAPTGDSSSNCLTINNLNHKEKDSPTAKVKLAPMGGGPTCRVLWLTENLGGTMPS